MVSPLLSIGYSEAQKIKFDWISAVLMLLLIATLIAFFTGVFPYPYGWIILAALLAFRVTGVQKQE